MKTQTHIYSKVTYWVALVPGQNVAHTFKNYQDAWSWSEKVHSETGRVALVEPVYR